MTGGRDLLTVSIAKVPAMFYLSRLPVMSHISCSPPTNALLLPLGTCTPRLRLVTAPAARGAAGLTCTAWELRGCCFESPGGHLQRWAETLHLSLWAFRPPAPRDLNGNHKPRAFVPEGEALLREERWGMPLPFWLYRQVLPGQIFNPFCFS